MSLLDQFNAGEFNQAFNENAVYTADANGSMFLQGSRGLIDSINRLDETTFKRYKVLKSQDWDENEFPLVQCVSEFQNPDYAVETELMYNNIGYQYSGDSNAANSLVPMIAPFCPNSDAWLWFQQQGTNEGLHALSYSEIVRLAMPNSHGVLDRIRADIDTMARVRIISQIFNYSMMIGRRIGDGVIALNSDEASDALMLTLCAIYVFERCQFMPSFANTAALYNESRFIPVAQTVRKIAIDEFGTHIPQVRYFIEHEMKVPQRAESMRRIRPVLLELLHEVIYNEVKWNQRQFGLMKGGSLLGMTESMSEDYVYYSATDVAQVIGITPNTKVVTRNPLPFMDAWLDLNTEQKASMEVKGSNYLVGQLVHEVAAEDRRFNLDGI